MSPPKARRPKQRVPRIYVSVADRATPRKLRGIEPTRTEMSVLSNIPYRDLLANLPIKGDRASAHVIADIAAAIENYRELAAVPPSPRRREEIRDQLSKGRELVRNIARQKGALAKWIGTIDIEVRSYLLGGVQIDGHALRKFKAQMEAEVEWMMRRIDGGLDAAIRLVPKTQGRRGNQELQLLVRWLSKIWEEHTGKPLTRTNKGKVRPKDFVMAACLLADKAISEGAIENAIKEVIMAHHARRAAKIAALKARCAATLAALKTRRGENCRAI